MRKRIKYAMVMGMLLPQWGAAQNLVPNGSFEEYTECPSFWNQLDRTVGWSRFRGSPDYFHSCDTGPYASVPGNVVGYQMAATGEAYAGAYLWCAFPGDSREHLGAMLTEPLIPGVPVSVSFKISPASGGFVENMKWSVQMAGLRFTVDPYLQLGNDPLAGDAALALTTAPSDTGLWYLVSGTYVPDSAYRYVVLGNFFDDSFLEPLLINPDADYPCSYVYFDDVCVSYAAGFCDGMQATHTSEVNDRLDVFPNPFNARFFLRIPVCAQATATIHLTDELGRVVWSGSSTGQELVEVMVDGLANGLFHLTLSSAGGGIYRRTVGHLSSSQ